MQVLVATFALLALLSILGLLRFSFNLIFVYLFLLSFAACLWSWRALKQARARDAGAEEGE